MGHDVFTVAFNGWRGIKNGSLLLLAGQHGFDVMVTLDQGIAYQQNAGTLPVAVVVISAASNDMDDRIPLVPALLGCLARLQPKTLVRVP